MFRALLTALLWTTAASAQVPYGTEFRVNSYMQNWQWDPSVAALNDGGFVVCWSSRYQDGDEYGVFAQRFDAAGEPVGKEFQVNLISEGSQEYSSIAALNDNGFIVCWNTSNRFIIPARRFDAAGVPSCMELQVNSYSRLYPMYPTVAALQGGGFVVCWQAFSDDGEGRDLFARCFDASGAPVSPEFQINSTPSYRYYYSVASLKNGGFVVCWCSDGQNGNGMGILARLFNAAGNPIGKEFRVNSHSQNWQWKPSVAGLNNGFIVCWESYEQDGDGYGIFARRFNARGVPLGKEFQVNTFATGDQTNPEIAALHRGGGFMVCWLSQGQDPNEEAVFAQLFNEECVPIGKEFRVSNFTLGLGEVSAPSVAAHKKSGFVVCYGFYTPIDEIADVFAKRYPVQPIRHVLRPFKLLSPTYDATVKDRRPRVMWQAASDQWVGYPWELEYVVGYDTLSDFSTASFINTGYNTTVRLPELKPGKVYFWKVRAKTFSGDSLWSGPSAFFVSHTATGVNSAPLPQHFLLANAPNPFNPSTTLRFELPNDGYVTVRIYDLTGRLVRTVFTGAAAAGEHALLWDGCDDEGLPVAAGVYLCRLEYTDSAGERLVQTIKMSLVK